MKIGLFYEHQLPRPWAPGAERDLLHDALDQIELADRLGFDHVWAVEHHFLEEYSHSSAPEVFLAAASQRTSRLRLGHGVVLLPSEYNHPARVAERAATLDLVSDGRLELGTGESSSEMEIGGFGVERGAKRDQWLDNVEALAHLMVEEPFAGWDGPGLKMPARNVVPKPLQRPHPPLWVACSRPETIQLAAEKGLGALSFAFVEPEVAKPWVDAYYATIASDRCVPAGFSVNANVAIVLPFLCHEDEATAVDRGIDGAHFFGYALAHYYAIGSHRPATTSIWDEFGANRAAFGFDRSVAGTLGRPLRANMLMDGRLSLRGAIGTPAQVRELLLAYAEAGVDQVILVAQAGTTQHQHICEAIELFARDVLPSLHDGEDEREEAKAARLAPFVEAALGRRDRRRPTTEGYGVTAAAAV